MMLTQGSLHLFVPQYRDKTQEGSDVRSVVFITCKLNSCVLLNRVVIESYFSHEYSGGT